MKTLKTTPNSGVRGVLVPGGHTRMVGSAVHSVPMLPDKSLFGVRVFSHPSIDSWKGAKKCK